MDARQSSACSFKSNRRRRWKISLISQTNLFRSVIDLGNIHCMPDIPQTKTFRQYSIFFPNWPKFPPIVNLEPWHPFGPRSHRRITFLSWFSTTKCDLYRGTSNGEMYNRFPYNRFPYNALHPLSLHICACATELQSLMNALDIYPRCSYFYRTKFDDSNDTYRWNPEQRGEDRLVLRLGRQGPFRQERPE